MARGRKRTAPAGLTPVEALVHDDTRVNIPTADAYDFVDEQAAKVETLLYPRDPSLDPQLVWKGKDEQDATDLMVDAPPIFIQEKIDPRVLIENLRDTARVGESEPELTLFDTFDGLEDWQTIEFYQHAANWSNRMILGDSLHVMASLAEKEGLRGQVQMIYVDPPYGIRFGSNWQASTRKRDVKDGKVEDATHEVEQIKAFRDTWEKGIHSYLSYLRDRLIVARDLLTESGSIFVQIGDENIQLAVRQSDSDGRRAANRLLAETYQCVGFAMANTGRSDLAWIAADRGILAAKQSEDRLMVAASSRLLAHTLLAMGRHDKAQQVAVTALTTLEPGLGSALPAQLSIYGALLQTSAVVAARRGDRAGANEFLTEAGIIAQRLGEDRNDFWTVFGPTDVGIHRASILVELGDAGRAVKQAQAIDPSHLPSLERRAHHLLDIAQGYGQWRKDHQALDSLLQAERLAPQEVHHQPVVQRLVLELLHRERRTTKPGLRELATRVGVLAA